MGHLYSSSMRLRHYSISIYLEVMFSVYCRENDARLCRESGSESNSEIINRENERCLSGI